MNHGWSELTSLDDHRNGISCKFVRIVLDWLGLTVDRLLEVQSEVSDLVFASYRSLMKQPSL